MIFPAYNDKPHAVVNLDDEARLWLAAHPDVRSPDYENPLLDPAICQRMIDEVHARLGVLWSHGGYMEDRSTLWAHSYMQADRRFHHLGVDFNVPTGTDVITRHRAEVIRIDDDRGEEGGWGPRLITRPTEGDRSHLLIHAHLAKDIRWRIGDILEPGTIIAQVGQAPGNGNWFPHLHVQAIRASHFEELLKTDLRTLDGYCTDAEKADALLRFPNPMGLI